MIWYLNVYMHVHIIQVRARKTVYLFILITRARTIKCAIPRKSILTIDRVHLYNIICLRCFIILFQVKSLISNSVPDGNRSGKRLPL